MKTKIIFLSILFLIFVNIEIFNSQKAFFNNQLELFFLDVGQGDAILIKTAQGKWGLIDSAKNNNLLEPLGKIIPSYMRELEFAVLTHPDADHIEGTIELIKRYKINYLFFNEFRDKSALSNEIVELAKLYKIKVLNLQVNNNFSLAEIQFNILWPDNNYIDTAIDNSNETSISIVMKYRDFEVYTAGDLGEINEIKTVENLKDLANIDVLKVGHHGSLTSTSRKFLEIINPKISIISVGEKNSYGHPNKEILDRLINIKSKILQTDLDGTIHLRTDGRTITAVGNTGYFEIPTD